MNYNNTMVSLPVTEEMNEFSLKKLPNHLKRDARGRARPRSKRYRILHDHEIVSEYDEEEIKREQGDGGRKGVLNIIEP